MAANWKRILIWTIIVLFVFALLIFVKQVFFPAPSPTMLMMDTMTLRTTNSTVERAELISDMDDAVRRIENDAIMAQWITLTDCLAAGTCSQDHYFDLLLMVAIEERDEVSNAELVANVITVNRYWGNSEKIVEFSKALSASDDQIYEIGLKTVSNKWQEIVDCDGKCAEFHQLFFEFTRLLLAV